VTSNGVQVQEKDWSVQSVKERGELVDREAWYDREHADYYNEAKENEVNGGIAGVWGLLYDGDKRPERL
jgi:hypothetical protein